MPTLPPLPAQPANLPFILLPAQWHWLGQVVTALHNEHQTILNALEHLMTQNDQVVSGIQANASAVQSVLTAVSGLGSRVSSEMADLAAAVAALPQSSPEVDAALSTLQASTSQLGQIADQVNALNTQLDSDDTAPAAPTA